MTPLSDAEAVKLLREFAQRITNAAPHEFASDYRERASEALAATAPQPPYTATQSGMSIYHGSPQKGGGPVVLDFTVNATPAEREACLAALNALHEKESAR